MTRMSNLLLIVFTLYCASVSAANKNNQISNLNKLIESRRTGNSPHAESWTQQDVSNLFPIYIIPQEGSMVVDKIDKLPGQPEVDFDHYAGYVTVDAKAERALFYYFAESPQNSSTKPLVMWLNGGQGCSSFGFGAMEELGPLRVNSDGKTLYRNDYAWNNVANIIFLESPAGTGFSYSNRSSDYTTGDKQTAKDSYTFLVNWLNRFPQYKTRDFFLTGQGYAGHYVPQLASLILTENKKRNQTIINLKGIALGNAWIDDNTFYEGVFDYYWTHALNSDETHVGIKKYCDYISGNFSDICKEYQRQWSSEVGAIGVRNIYAPLCDVNAEKPRSPGSLKDFDPCYEAYVATYLNQADVQEALHARNTSWSICSLLGWTDSPTTILPTINQLIEDGIIVWIYSGDIDGLIPVTSSRYAVNKLKLPVKVGWRPWYYNKEVGGYVVGYKGSMVLTTIRGAGHEVASYQPERALVMISSFLQGKLPPSSTG